MFESLTNRNPTHSGKEQDLDRLCELVTGLSPEELQVLRKKLLDRNVYISDVSEALPDAIRRSLQKDESLTTIFAPLIENGVEQSVHKDPKKFGDLLSPVMGPAIRAAVANSMRSFIDSTDRILQQSFSPQGMKWRFEAFRTGKSFAEIALFHTVEYRVEHLFLIRKEDGILLQHAALKEAQSKSPDLISGMLTAIQDFVRESFDLAESDQLGSIEIGDLTVEIVSGSDAILAAVVRGNPPSDYQLKLKQTIEQFHYEYREQLAHFDGDTETFFSFTPAIERLLEVKFKPEEKKVKEKSYTKWYLLLAVLAIIAILWSYLSYLKRSEWSSFVSTLRKEQGFTLTENYTDGSTYIIHGLRDSGAIEAQALIPEISWIGAQNYSLTFTPYISLDPKMIETRARRILEAPAGVGFRFKNGLLQITGETNSEWLSKLKKYPPEQIEGVERTDLSKLINIDIVELDALVERVVKISIPFTSSESVLRFEGEQAAGRLRIALSRVMELAKASGAPLDISIYAHSGGTGRFWYNKPLADERIQSVKRFLVTSDPALQEVTARRWNHDQQICTVFKEHCKDSRPFVYVEIKR